jgi:MFS family permease
MLPMRFFRSRAFSAANAVSLAMYFGVFGSIFLLAQFLQTAQGYSPLAAGLRTLPWTAMPIVVAPFAGMLSDRTGSRPLLAAGLALQATAIAWLAVILAPGVSYTMLVVPFVLAGTGMAMVFAPAANAVLASVAPAEAGQASGATNAIRELGGVLGIAILASVFSAHGSYATPSSFAAGLTAALPVGAAFLAVGAVIALLIPRPSREHALAAGSYPKRVVLEEEGRPLLLRSIPHVRDPLEVLLSRCARAKVQQHLGWRTGGVLKAVDSAGRHVDPVPGLGIDPLVAVENGDAALEDVERLRDRPVEMRIRAARPGSHLPAVQPELSRRRGARRQVVDSGPARPLYFRCMPGAPVRRGGFATVPAV